MEHNPFFIKGQPPKSKLKLKALLPRKEVSPRISASVAPDSPVKHSKLRTTHSTRIVHHSHVDRLVRYVNLIEKFGAPVHCSKLFPGQDLLIKAKSGQTFYQFNDHDMAKVVDYMMDVIGWLLINRTLVDSKIHHYTHGSGNGYRLPTKVNTDFIVSMYCMSCDGFIHAVRLDQQVEVFGSISLLGDVLRFEAQDDPPLVPVSS